MTLRLLEYLRRELLRELTTSALAMPQTVDAYGHANGFDKLTLPTPGLPVVVRIHMWRIGESKSSTASIATAHNHRWDFCSRILSGGIQVSLFDVQAGSGPYRHYLYRPGTQDDLRLVGSAQLGLKEVVTYDVGDCYYEPHEVVHVATPTGEDPLVTIIAHSRAERSYADVYAESRSPRVADRLAPLSRVDVVDHLTRVSQLLVREASATGPVV